MAFCCTFYLISFAKQWHKFYVVNLQIFLCLYCVQTSCNCSFIKQLLENNMLASGYFFKNIVSFSCWRMTIVMSIRPRSINHAFVDVLFFSLILIWYYLHVNDMPPKKKSRLIDVSKSWPRLNCFQMVQDNHQKCRGWKLTSKLKSTLVSVQNRAAAVNLWRRDQVYELRALSTWQGSQLGLISTS